MSFLFPLLRRKGRWLTGLTLIPAGALAQTPPAPPQVQTMPGATPDADALASAMRHLGSNPRDFNALVEAGELSLKLGDTSGAASLFKRAEQINPTSGRVKAGMARILVAAERPGEALRYFAQATTAGLDPVTFAGDRGLAYDLVGQQERAQRDYRLALKSGQHDEVVRRYALSLGISGQADEAEKLLEPLLRRQDRAAWRAHTFVMAINGDVEGARKVANRMMPGAMAGGLAPFYGLLAGLQAADRAFAVHFGDPRATPARIADARMAPPLPALGPDSDAARVQVAAAAVPLPDVKTPAQRRAEERAAKRERQLAERAEAAARRRDARSLARNDDRPRSAGPSRPGFSTTEAVRPAASQVASASTTRRPAAPASTQGFAPPRGGPVPPVATVPDAARAVPPARVDVASATGAAAPTPSAVPSASPPARTAINTASAATPGASAGAAPALTPTPTAVAQAAPPPATPAPLPVATRRADAPAVASTPTPPRMGEDSILARIIANLSIPGAELGIEPVRPPAAVPTVEAAAVAATPLPPTTGERTEVAAARTTSRVETTTPPRAATKSSNAAGAESEVPKPVPSVDGKAAATKVTGKTPAAEVKTTSSDKPVVKAKDAAAVKNKPAEKKPKTPADPARIWVQVAGGANEGDLPKAWKAAQAKAPALKARDAYSTPLRATNRVVTGPFKTDAEARAFVNTLSKQGVSAFAFTSAEGQKMTRLNAK